MALLRFFKTPKHQRFGYIPRHWNPEREELLERVERAKRSGEGDTEAIKSRLKGGFRTRGGYMATNNSRARQTARSNIILIIVIFGLIVVSYIAIEVYLPMIMKMLE